MHCMGTDAAGPLEPPKPEEPQSNDRPNKDQLQGVRDHFAQAVILTKNCVEVNNFVAKLRD